MSNLSPFVDRFFDQLILAAAMEIIHGGKDVLNLTESRFTV